MKIREAQHEDLQDLLALYLHLHETDIPPNDERLRNLWRDILNEKDYHIMLCEHDGQIVSSVTLVIINNLTRSLRPYTIIENVVTHPNYRRRGFASALMNEAKRIAEQRGCYKIMLMTGSKKAETLDFYRNCGFDDGEKTGFIKRFD